MPTLINLSSQVYVFAAILWLLLFSFLIFSLLPSFVVSRRLSRVIKKLTALDGKPDGSLEQVFQQGDVLSHLWQEYADSLHQQASNEGSESIRFRSTMPAGMVFRPDILVDIPLRTDFFKHLPGLFTGVGIIGTFYGLLMGLKSFVVSENPVIVRASLTQLLHGVSEAFLVSAAAITMAMVITFIEKLVLTRLNAKVEMLVQLLDGLFESGAGEEYLARLVKATEASSTQNAGLLKGELKQILIEVSEAQIAAGQATSVALGDRITASITEGLQVPLAEIASSLKNANNDQGAALEAMLGSMFENFTQQMQTLLGGQANEMGSLQQQTIAALQSTVARLEEMASSMGEAGQRSTEAMAEQVAKANAAAELRQSVMNDKLSEFVEQMRLANTQSQGAQQEQLHVTLNELSGHIGSVIESLSAQVASTTDVNRQHQQDLVAQSQNFVGQFSGQISEVVEGVTLAVAEMKSAVTMMRTTTGEAVSSLNSSADILYAATKDFALAGQEVVSILDKSALVAVQLSEAAENV